MSNKSEELCTLRCNLNVSSYVDYRIILPGCPSLNQHLIFMCQIFCSSFWSGVVHNAVVVEADAFKETDVIYRQLSSMAKDDIGGTAELVNFDYVLALQVLMYLTQKKI
jgi:hypothetical protein